MGGKEARAKGQCREPGRESTRRAKEASKVTQAVARRRKAPPFIAKIWIPSTAKETKTLAEEASWVEHHQDRQ